MTFTRNIMRYVPIDIAVAGRKRNLIFKTLDPICRHTVEGDVIDTPVGAIELDHAREPERLLSYAFPNVLRYYERSPLGQYLRMNAQPGGSFIDVGANLGMYSLVAREYGYATFVVEPEPDHNAFLQRNESTFGSVLPLAFSDAPGSLPLYYLKSNPGATSLYPHPAYMRGENVVPVETFSNAVLQGRLGDPSAIRIVKIDVEGLESRVVNGMSGFLATGARPDIWCEVRGDRSARNGGSYRRVSSTLADFGYSPTQYNEGTYTGVDETDLADRTVFDLLYRSTP